MENKNYQFKTNINCGGCVASVKSHLDNLSGVCDWNVDTANKDKILSVNSNGVTTEEIIDKVKSAGFKIELLNK